MESDPKPDFRIPSREERDRAARHVDDVDVVEKARHWRALEFVLEMERPPNLWGIGLDGEAVIRIAQAEEIALSWVPGLTVARKLVSSAGPSEREGVLRDEVEVIAADCEAVLGEIVDPELVSDRDLVVRALVARRDGHREAATALLGTIGEPLAIWASTPRIQFFRSNEDEVKYREAVAALRGRYKQAAFEEARGRHSFLYRLLIAPIPKYFASWRPDSGLPQPSLLSRHALAHGPGPAQFTEANFARALMLVTSLLREQQEWADEVQRMDRPDS